MIVIDKNDTIASICIFLKMEKLLKILIFLLRTTTVLNDRFMDILKNSQNKCICYIITIDKFPSQLENKRSDLL